MVVEDYGYRLAWSTSAIMLTASFLSTYCPDSSIQIGLRFDPFAGYYDVTISGDTITDYGATF